MEKKTYHAGEKDATIAVHGGEQDLLDRVFELLKQRGFVIQTDRRILEEYPILADTHWEGTKDDLLFKCRIYPAGFSFEFYQEVNTKNPHGGFYDLDKFGMMPYLIRCRYMVERKYIQELLEQEGFNNVAKPYFKYALDNVMFRIKNSAHYKEGKELPSYEFAYYNATDKDGKQLRNGQVKYFRDYKGRLQRGVIYHNINNMWWFVFNKFDFTNVASFDLFDLDTEKAVQKRIINHKMPERIRSNKLREKFESLGLSYEKINAEHITMLRIILTKEIDKFDSDMELKLSTPRKKDMKILQRTGLQYAKIQVDGYYFSRREAITFNSTGCIGFADWASDYNLTPFLNAFDKWMDWLLETIEKVA